MLPFPSRVLPLHSLLVLQGSARLLLAAALVPASGPSPARKRGQAFPQPFEATHPAASLALRQMQRDHRTRLLATAILRGPQPSPGDAAMAIEDGLEDQLLLHYIAPEGRLTLAAGWLGSGRRRYIWVPLRPTLAWTMPPPEPGVPNEAVSVLFPEQISRLAIDLHAGLLQLDQRHVIEEFLMPSPSSAAERQQVLDRYTSFMRQHGWVVRLDDSQSRRSIGRTIAAEDTAAWPLADREELARLEALVTQVLPGDRASSRVLFQNK